jgi:hypothetical protein
MSRFRLTIWDREGITRDRVLDSATNLDVKNELNGEHTLSFEMPVDDSNYSFLSHRKIVRLEDTAMGTYATTVVGAPSSTKVISVQSGENFNIGDFLLVYETPDKSISKRTTAALTSATPATVNLDSSASISVGDYLKIEDENDSEIIKVLTIPDGTSITANVANSYEINAAVTTPGRSLIAKITSARKASTTTVNAEAASPGAVVVEVNSTEGIRPGDYVYINDGTNEEAAYVDSIVVSTSITVSSLDNSYNAGATVTNYSFTLSRRDFRPDDNADVRKVNFTSYRVASFSEERNDGILTSIVNCNHISYDLNDQYFLIDGRGDISYSVKGSGIVKSDKIDIDSLLDELLVRQVDSSDDPIDTDRFFKGDLYSFVYSTGTISVTNGSPNLSGSGTTWRDDNISSGSIVSIEGDENLYTVASVSNDTLIILTGNVGRENGSSLEYFIISAAIQTASTDKIGTCSVRQAADDEVSSISVAVNDGTIKHGAVFMVEGDAKQYYVEKVRSSSVLDVTEDIERSADTSLDFILKRDEREIAFSSATTLLGCLNEIAKVWSDDEAEVWYEIYEDKSINIRRKPIPDDRDPTGDLVVKYGYNIVKNLSSVKRLYDQTEFGNRVMATGARSGWINAVSGVSASVASSSNNRKTAIQVASLNTKKFRPGDYIEVFQDKTDITTITSATQVTLTKTGAGWDIDEFRGGLVLITSGEGINQLRAVVSNTATVITVSRAWDTLPTGSNAIVAKNIGDTQVRCAAYKRFKVDAATSTTITCNNYAPAAGSYRGGILMVVTGTGQGQYMEISYNEVSGGNTTFTINGTFSPTPTTSSYVEVEAPLQIAEEYRSGTTFTATTVAVVPASHGFPPWIADLWNSGTLYVTTGADAGNNYSISDTTYAAGTGTITISAPFGTTPASGDGILIVIEHDLPITVAKLPFVPDSGDTAVLLLHETGGALTVGKYADYRGTVASATQTTITVQSTEGARFAAYQMIFVGAKTVTSDLLFGMNRGNQAFGQVVTIESVSANTITTVETLNPTPQPGDHVEIIAIVDEDSIIAKGRVELLFDASDINNPKELYIEAKKFLDNATAFSPRYEVDFLHLYELDPKVWQFDNYNLGDTVRVIDDEMGLDTSSLRIIREEYNPNMPADVKIQVANSPKLLKSQTRTIAEVVQAKLDVLEPEIDINERMFHVPTCIYWDEEDKKCSRTDVPNVYCNTDESNRDGRLTSQKQRITIFECGEYSTPKMETLQSFRDYWSTTSATVTITGASTTISITPTVVIPSGDEGIPLDAAITCAHLLLRWRESFDSSSSPNAIDSSTMKVQIDDSGNTGWLDSYTFADNSIHTLADATANGEPPIESITDISARVDEADTYDIQILNAKADGGNLVLRDFAWGIRVFWN